jgi:undecaprenyl-diphosphatase
MRETSSSSAPSLPAVRTRALIVLLVAAVAVGCLILALMGYVQPVVMGIVQGLGEFLPISSSAHLIVVPWLFGWHGTVIDTLTFDVALHLGTLVALVIYFWRDWLALIGAVPGYVGWLLGTVRRDGERQLAPAGRLLHLVLIATIPGAILGLLLERLAEDQLRSVLLIAATLPIMGLILYASDRWSPARKNLETISWRDALLIGVSQACALIPGVSRSGATLTMGRFLALDRTAAARFSFLLSGPITAAAVLLKLEDILSIPPNEIAIFAIGVLVSGIVGALAIGFLLSYIRRAGLGLFAAYRVVAAVVILLVYFNR